MEPEAQKEFMERLREIPARDFDGHTEFQDMTPEQRLEWLASAVQFRFEVRRDQG